METNFYSQHLSLQQLRNQPETKHNNYLHIDVPAYPRPVLHVTHVSHSTDLDGFRRIMVYTGFKSPGYRRDEPKVVWFSLTPSRAELREAEGRSVTIVHPNGTEERFEPVRRLQHDQGEAAEAPGPEDGFLQTFATSPVFLSSSRLGSFCFTLPLQDVLDNYSRQFCRGEKPVMRVWKTVLYKQKVMYAVLVHSPDNQDEFSDFPLLQGEETSICAFREEPEPHFIWRPQAMSETHEFELQVNPENHSLSAEPCPSHDEADRRIRLSYYVWDEVSLALHVGHEDLRFKNQELQKSVRFCEMGNPPRPISVFQTFEEAQSQVPWPLQRYSESEVAINP
ncbi:hypothetical protein WMY93_028877 [Mugilogobius chulae]|uniref:Uncharacterized protein n=1 Tax=Mugilogobius chulae TaxID=88201 RepID=A0AAW0MWB5_9GOBI